MADQTHTVPTRGAGSTGLAFLLGVLVVVVGFLAWTVFGNGDLARDNRGGGDVSIGIEGPDTPLEKAAESLSK